MASMPKWSLRNATWQTLGWRDGGILTGQALLVLLPQIRHMTKILERTIISKIGSYL